MLRDNTICYNALKNIILPCYMTERDNAKNTEEKTDAWIEPTAPIVPSPKLSKDRKDIDPTLAGFDRICTARHPFSMNRVEICGYNLHIERVSPTDDSHLQSLSSAWPNKKSWALTSLGNTLASKLKHLTTQDLSNEIYLTDAEMASPEYNTLQDKPVEDLRTRFTILSSLYRDLEKFLSFGYI